MYFHYMKSIKFIKIFVVPTSDACIENQLFGASGMFYHSGSHMLLLSPPLDSVLSKGQQSLRGSVLEWSGKLNIA